MNFNRDHLFDLAERFLAIKEVGGAVDNPQIMSMLKLDNSWPTNDEVPWCSAFVNYIAPGWLELRAPRISALVAGSRSAAALSSMRPSLAMSSSSRAARASSLVRR